jgi:hypothetical protein
MIYNFMYTIYMKWTHVTDEFFCEGKIFGIPEYINAFSSLFISCMGLIGIILNDASDIYYMIHYLLVVNGIASFGYHWTLEWGWKLMDQSSMLILICIGNYMLYNKISKIISQCIMIYLIFTLSMNGTSIHELTFSYLFLVPSITLIPGLLINITNKKLLFRGCLLCICGGLFWYITELLCDTYNWLAYTCAHAIWHITISYGMYIITQCIMLINNNTYELVQKNTFFYKIVPCLQYTNSNTNNEHHFSL